MRICDRACKVLEEKAINLGKEYCVVLPRGKRTLDKYRVVNKILS